MQDDRTSRAIELMVDFADRTGVLSTRWVRRYLWTDAFAVCNFIGLERATSDHRFGELALGLVAQVHRELGRYRTDDARVGWISGLSPDEGEAHPTIGGLRIGKPLPECSEAEPFDPDLEWDRDGQYFHYLTNWAHALDQMARTTSRSTFHGWARELIETAHRAFTYGPPGRRRMAWKLSTDLKRRIVPSMGQHDPLDGVVTCAQLDATAAVLEFPADPNLTAAAAGFAGMLDERSLATSDPLGLGALLFDACRLAQLEPVNRELISAILEAASVGLAVYVTDADLRAPASRRLGFRELGLTIGLACLSMLERDCWMDRLDPVGRASVESLAAFAPLRIAIESFWLRPENRRAPAWVQHADINDVMLATSLAPEGFIELRLG